MKKKINSLSFKNLIHLIIFSLSILVILYLFQNVFVKTFYEKYRLKDIKKVANTIINKRNNIDDYLEKVSYKKEFCIEVIDYNLEKTYYNEKMPGCILKNNKSINYFKRNFILSTKNKYYYNLVNPDYNVKSILYSLKKNDKYIFIYTQLEDIDSTNLILNRQLKYILLIVILFAIFISYLISKKISKPIVKLTKEARKLGTSNFKEIKIDSNITEIQELTNTFNYVGNELNKIEDLRRDLLANVSHDLKTPLTMIKAYAEMIRDLSYKNEKKRNEHLNIIISETERLNILVNDILELSKLQAEADKLDISEFDLVQVIKEILNKYVIIEETKNYKFITKLPDTCIIKADKNKLTQVIYNLINNAINYTGKDNKVYLKLEEKDKIYFSVRDTGKGIATDDIKYIWDKYYKAKKNHQRQVVGTGIGLSIVKQILEKHNYDYGVKSTKNKGSEFYFYINK